MIHGHPFWGALTHEAAMQRMTDFWQRYCSGEFQTLDDFKAGAAQLGRERDADPDYIGWQSFVGRDLSNLKELDHAPLVRLQFPSHFNSPAHMRQDERADWQHVDWRLRLFSASLIEALRRKHIPMWVHSAFRTPDEQAAAHASGNSQLGGLRAPHRQAKAVDIIHGKYAWDLTRQEWAHIGKIGKEVLARMNRNLPKKDQLELVWGGDWSNPWDPAHWEIKSWRDNIVQLPIGQPVRLRPRLILSQK